MSRLEPIISPTEKDLLCEDIFRLKGHKLFEIGALQTYYAPMPVMPHCMREISRLREITYREVGEGTGKSSDTDVFDTYFYHLFIWDTETLNIVGAYRIGWGKEIITQYGVNGFYISTLFDLDNQFFPVLEKGIELGRSFIVKEYQKKHAVLLVLWKSILEILIRNDIQYMIGPVSLDGRYSDTVKALLIKFLKDFYLDPELSKWVRSKNKITFNIDPAIDLDAFRRETHGDFFKLDKYLKRIDPNYNTPVLYRQYASLINGKVLGFNVDPLFNNCMDTLMLVDLSCVSREFIRNLSRKI